MALVELQHTLDLGDADMQGVRVEAYVLKNIAGQIFLDIVAVRWLGVDILASLRPAVVLAMAEALKHTYWAEAFRGREAVGESAL